VALPVHVDAFRISLGHRHQLDFRPVDQGLDETRGQALFPGMLVVILGSVNIQGWGRAVDIVHLEPVHDTSRQVV
jgi:hypothetical protein